jgi:predicted XRE-type DNA-binding protein
MSTAKRRDATPAIPVRQLTQIAAVKLVGIKQPDLSNILRSHYQGFFVERLMRRCAC